MTFHIYKINKKFHSISEECPLTKRKERLAQKLMIGMHFLVDPSPVISVISLPNQLLSQLLRATSWMMKKSLHPSLTNNSPSSKHRNQNQPPPIIPSILYLHPNQSQNQTKAHNSKICSLPSLARRSTNLMK